VAAVVVAEAAAGSRQNYDIVCLGAAGWAGYNNANRGFPKEGYMVRRRDRIIALVIAIAFFATSFAVSFLVIWELVKGNKEDKVVDDSTSIPAQPLKGTKLKDFTPLEKVDSLQKVDTKVGTGKEVKPGDTITVDYTGALAADGTIFESSLDSGQPATFSLSGVIKPTAAPAPAKVSRPTRHSSSMLR
jgi:hypothetical protein